MHKGLTSLVLQAFYNTPWAIMPARLAAIAAVIDRWASGEKLSQAQIAAAIDRRDTRQAATTRRSAGKGAVAVLPIFGTIAHRAHMVEDVSGPGGTSTEKFTLAFRRAVADPEIGHIVLDVDSPGGSVEGVPELAAEIFKARGEKPITAVANALAASAAYWIASAADELVVTPSGEVGSIGVFAAHEDLSEHLEAAGIKITLISAGKHKTETSPFAPLSDEAREAIQHRVDDYYGMFIRDVARQRGVSPKDVRGGFGQGRVVGAREAVAEGMADRVATLDDVLRRAGVGSAVERKSLAGGEGEGVQELIDDAPESDESVRRTPVTDSGSDKDQELTDWRRLPGVRRLVEVAARIDTDDRARRQRHREREL